MLAGAYAVFVHRLSVLGWPFPPTLSGLVASLPKDIVPLWKSGDVAGQLAAFWRSDAPADLPWFVAPVVLAACGYASRRRAWNERALWRLAAGLWAAVTAFFFVNDPQNRFVYAGTLLVPAVFAAAVPRHWPGAAVLLLAHLCRPPQYAPAGNPALAEAAYLAERLGPGDVLVALSEPDWALSYGLMGRASVIALAGPDAATERFGQRVLGADAAQRAIDETLCNGGKAVFAADALYRSSQRDASALDADAQRLVARWSRRYAAGRAWVSPQDQHYMPLAAKARLCAP